MPSAVAPKAITSVRIFTKPPTVAIRAASSARICPSSSASAGGTMSVTASAASRRSRREITASMPSHNCSSVISVPYPVTSNSRRCSPVSIPCRVSHSR